jgi:hypothetical protein
MTKKRLENYWNPTIILEDATHKERFKEVCRDKKISCARLLGKAIAATVRKRSEERGARDAEAF